MHGFKPSSIFLVVVVALALGPGCASLQSTSISGINKGPGHRIHAEDTAHGFFMLSMPDLDAVARLKAQCAGPITGVMTTTWLRNWLLVQHYHQEAVAWCQSP
jgi:hypothetical protein